jgi:hypothetical protein
MSEANTNILYTGTDKGLVFRIDSCRTNNLTGKTNITGANFPGGYVSCVEVDRLNQNNVMVTFANYGVKSVFYTSDAGANWTDVSGNLEQNPDGSGNGPSVTWANIYNDGSSVKYFVGTSTGLYSTDNLNGTNTVWLQEGANSIGNVVINMITSRTFDNNIVVATHGNGIYSNKVFTPSAVSEISSEKHIACYPNPFDNSVTVDFGIEAKGDVEAEIYDLTGRLVRRLSARNSSKITWNGRDLNNNLCASGTYLVKMTANDKTITGKVVKL